MLWDKKLNTIVNNESAEIIRMLSTEFNEFAKNPTLDLFPVEHREKIEEVNTHVYTSVNDGVYKCGFARKFPSRYDHTTYIPQANKNRMMQHLMPSLQHWTNMKPFFPNNVGCWVIFSQKLTFVSLRRCSALIQVCCMVITFTFYCC